MKKKKILFITRNYPPIIGGMEKYSYDFYNNLKKIEDVTLLANTKGKKLLPIFFIKSLFYILFRSRKYTHIHLGDGVLSPLGLIAKLFSKAKVSITIHALDITYNNIFYQWFIPKCINKLDKIVCVSNYTINECVKRKISKDKCIFIPNGIDFENLKDTKLKLNDIEKKYSLNLSNKIVLFSIGRLIKRKGNEWFVSNIMPKLDPKFIYIIAGDGPERENIKKTIISNKLEKKVFLLGKISDDEKICLYKNSTWFIMPNIKVKGDAEGFGITLIEAAAYGLPSIASNIEGIKDAVINGKTGWLVENFSVEAFFNKINSKVLKLKGKFFDWRKIINKYRF
jgi:glycosyltransferase involved in cell wall biosynthesis